MPATRQAVLYLAKGHKYVAARAAGVDLLSFGGVGTRNRVPLRRGSEERRSL